MEDWTIDGDSNAGDVIDRFDRMGWVEQVRFVSTTPILHPRVMRYVAKSGDPAARMALALRTDVPAYIRRRLAQDENPQVRANLLAVDAGMVEA